MRTQKLDSTDAFIVFDLNDAPMSVGVTRAAPKILPDGARLLARSMTYLFATFEWKVGGASAGINAKPDGRADAVSAFVSEALPLTKSRSFLTEAARGVGDADLAPLREADDRSPIYFDHHHELVGLGAAVAADAALGGLEGRTVAIESLDGVGAPLVRGAVERGARVVAVSTANGTVSDPSGLDSAALLAALDDHGAALVDQLGHDPTPGPSVFGAEADVLFVGSKAGVLGHDRAAGVRASAVVPWGPVPVTAKALAVLRRADVLVLPDFVSTAGPLYAMWPPADATVDSVRASAIVGVLAVIKDVLAHDDGPLLGACQRAEAFLATWQDDLPFGRPLA